jgi:hypothetical protein
LVDSGRAVQHGELLRGLVHGRHRIPEQDAAVPRNGDAGEETVIADV